MPAENRKAVPVVEVLGDRGAGQLTLVDPATDPVWAHLASGPGGSLFSAPPWIGALGKTYDLEISAWVANDAFGEPIAGVPFARLPSSRGERISVLPFSDYCDPICGSDGTWELLSDRLLDTHQPVAIRVLHNDECRSDPRLAPKRQDWWHAIDLDREVDDMWSDMSSSARRAIRRAEASELTVRLGQGPADLRSFYELHRSVRKAKYRLLAQPFAFFEELADAFGDRLILMTAWLADELVAGVLYLAWQDTLYYKFNASSSEHLDVRPNDAMMWEGMKLARASGYRSIDLGRSDDGHEGLLRYKRKFATSEAHLTELRSLGSAPVDDLDLDPVWTGLTELLTRREVPDEITEEAGALLYRFFA